ncbi:hypothetical protein NL533_34130, partial [Klebsiella pneumoniae]|nr:hypothetical protein [Klebsiella pneumoniae]
FNQKEIIAKAGFEKPVAKPDLLYSVGDDSPITPNLDMSKEARMKRAEEQGFDTKIPVYTGRYADFDAFNPDRTAYWTEDPQY